MCGRARSLRLSFLQLVSASCELPTSVYLRPGPKKTRTRLSERLSSKTGFLKQQASHVWALKLSKVLHALGFKAPKMGSPSVSLLCNLHFGCSSPCSLMRSRDRIKCCTCCRGSKFTSCIPVWWISGIGCERRKVGQLFVVLFWSMNWYDGNIR